MHTAGYAGIPAANAAMAVAKAVLTDPPGPDQLDPPAAPAP